MPVPSLFSWEWPRNLGGLSRKVSIEDIWHGYEESRFGRLDAADDRLDHALCLDPRNAYLEYLRRDR
jgi:hypothetical protein